MNYLITGCAGFIGSHMVDLILESSDDTVIGVDCFTYAAKQENLNSALESDRFTLFKEDICSTDKIRAICENHNITNIVNFAAETHVDNSIDSCDSFIRSNILGVKSLLEVVKGTKIRMIHVSTDEVYGSRVAGHFLEQDKFNPRNPYSATKASAEHLISSYNNTYNMRVTTVRPSNNFGPRQHGEKFLPTVIRSLSEGKKVPVYGDGKNVRDWLYVKDNVKAIYHLSKDYLHTRISSSFNITNNNEMTNLDMVKNVCEVLGKDFEKSIEFVKDRPGHDFRYAISNRKLLSSGFVFDSDFKKNLEDTIKSLGNQNV